MRNERIAATSAVGIAGAALSLLTAFCCSIPALSTVLVAVLGVSGSVALASLAPYRPWIMAGSAALIAFTLYISFKRPCARAGRIAGVSGAVVWLFSFFAALFVR